jgi:hypothetical protein
MKRLVLFGIVIFLIIIGGFLMVDKVWLHKVFKITPGSCLILEEKYCKTGKIEYVENKAMGIVYKVKKNTPIFSPMTEGYTISEIKENDLKIFTVKNKVFKDKNIKSDGFEIYFNGNFVEKIIDDVDSKKIIKGKLFSYTTINSNKEITVFMVPIKTFLNDFDQIQSDVDEDKILKINNDTKNR